MAKYKFSDLSKKHLSECDPKLQEIAKEAIDTINFTVITGIRTKAEQERKVRKGLSEVHWPNSKHNVKCEGDKSQAFDLAPYPIDWKDTDRFYLLAGIIIQIAKQKGIEVRWGGDWDSDFDLNDQKFNDLGHFELV